MRAVPLLLLLLLPALGACDNDPVENVPDIVPERFSELGVGDEHSCGVAPDGRLFCWGSNASGQLGDGTSKSSTVPVRVQSSTPVVQVTGGAGHTCALGASGAIHCWGANERGQLGTGDRAARQTPTAVAPGFRFGAVSAGAFHTCAITSDRRIYCWGAGDHGGTGTPDTQDVLVPQEIQTDIRFVTVAAGGAHTCAIDTGSVGHCWGRNDQGQLGDASFFDRRLPGRPVYGDDQYRRVVAGAEHTCAISTAGLAFCWGSNKYGELGEGAAPVATGGAVIPFPVRIEGATNEIAVGAYFSCLADSSRIAWCWGRGSEGQLGYGGRFDYFVPQRVNDPDLSTSTRFIRLDMGLHHACGLTATENIYCWGRGDHGQLGAGPLLHSSLPVRIVTGS